MNDDPPVWIRSTTEGMHIVTSTRRRLPIPPVVLAVGGLTAGAALAWGLGLPTFVAVAAAAGGYLGGGWVGMAAEQALSTLHLDTHRVQWTVTTPGRTHEEHHEALADIVDAVPVKTYDGYRICLVVRRDGVLEHFDPPLPTTKRAEAEWLAEWIREHAPGAVPLPELSEDQVRQREQLLALLHRGDAVSDRGGSETA